MRYHGLVDMHRPLGTSGGAAGEMEQRQILGLRGGDRECVAGLRHQRLEILRSLGRRRMGVQIGNQDMRQIGQGSAQSDHLARVERGGGHQDPRLTDAHALMDGLGTESGKHGAEHAAVLERAQCAEVQRRDATHEGEHRITASHAEIGEHVGEAIGELAQPEIAEIVRRTLLVQPAQRDVCAPPRLDMAIDGFIGDIESAVRQTVDGGAGSCPAEVAAFGRIIGQMRPDLHAPGGLADDVRGHGAPPFFSGMGRL